MKVIETELRGRTETCKLFLEVTAVLLKEDPEFVIDLFREQVYQQRDTFELVK